MLKNAKVAPKIEIVKEKVDQPKQNPKSSTHGVSLNTIIDVLKKFREHNQKWKMVHNHQRYEHPLFQEINDFDSDFER